MKELERHAAFRYLDPGSGEPGRSGRPRVGDLGKRGFCSAEQNRVLTSAGSGSLEKCSLSLSRCPLMLDKAQRTDTRLRCVTLVGVLATTKATIPWIGKGEFSVHNKPASRRKFLKAAATTIAVPHLIPANVFAVSRAQMAASAWG